MQFQKPKPPSNKPNLSQQDTVKYSFDERLMSVVQQAEALHYSQRQAYLEVACEGNDQLLQIARVYVLGAERMDAAGFLTQPVIPSVSDPFFQRGQRLLDRFRIARQVDEGGMGVVYEAFDEKLGRRIAIKCAKAGHGSRLPPEVLNASQISHSNVCKIFDIHTASGDRGEIEFMSMEFLEGETLSGRLRRGAVPPEEARTIARQICAGLAEAHRQHVIHGDLKSNNVILTKDADGALRAVITDFGLAQRRETPQYTAQTADGANAGAPDYMAPELWKGKKSSIASDIYALGVILYELSAGHRPFTKETPIEIRLHQNPLSADSAHQPHPWDRMLGHCLDPDPIRRPQSVASIEKVIDPPSRKVWWLAGAAAALVAVLTGAITYQRAAGPDEIVRLAVMPFSAERTLEPEAESILRQATERIKALHGTTKVGFSLAPEQPEQQPRPLRQDANILPGVRSEKVSHFLQGSLRREANRATLQLALIDTKNKVTVRDANLSYDSGQLRYAPLAVAQFTAGALHLQPIPAPELRPAARKSYEEGFVAVFHDSTADAALRLMSAAVDLDPDSPITWAGLAEAQWYQYLLTPQQKWLEKTQESVRQAMIRGPDTAEVLKMTGMLAWNVGSYELAIRDLSRADEVQPNRPETLRRLGMAYEKANQLSQAEAALQKAIAVDPANPPNYNEMGSFYESHAQFEKAIEQFTAMVKLAPQSEQAHFARGHALRQVGRFAESESEMRVAISLRDYARARHDLAYVLMMMGRDQEAIAHYLRAIELGGETGLRLTNLAISYDHLGRSAEAAQTFQRALALAQQALKDPRDGWGHALVAYIGARLNQRVIAEYEMNQALQLSPENADVQWMAVLTYESLKQREKALELVNRLPLAVKQQLTRYPDLADLQRDSRFPR